MLKNSNPRVGPSEPRATTHALVKSRISDDIEVDASWLRIIKLMIKPNTTGVCTIDNVIKSKLVIFRCKNGCRAVASSPAQAGNAEPIPIIHPGSAMASAIPRDTIGYPDVVLNNNSPIMVLSIAAVSVTTLLIKN